MWNRSRRGEREASTYVEVEGGRGEKERSSSDEALNFSCERRTFSDSFVSPASALGLLVHLFCHFVYDTLFHLRLIFLEKVRGGPAREGGRKESSTREEERKRGFRSSEHFFLSKRSAQ